MEFDSDVYLLSEDFRNAYPQAIYPELMSKGGRPYNCLLIDTHDDYLICIPYRSNISHKNAYLFKNSLRSRQARSGLDFSKIVLIKNPNYIDEKKAIIDRDEYTETMSNLPIIALMAVEYVDRYIEHVKGKKVLHPQDFTRKYGYSTLKYFHDILLG